MPRNNVVGVHTYLLGFTKSEHVFPTTEMEDAIVCSTVVRLTLTHHSENFRTHRSVVSSNFKYSTQYEAQIEAMFGKNKSSRPVDRSAEVAAVDTSRESFPPLPNPGIEFQEDLHNLVLNPVDEFKSDPDDRVSDLNVSLDINVAVGSVVASAPVSAAAGPPSAAAAPSIVVDPPAVCGDGCPTETGLETG